MAGNDHQHQVPGYRLRLPLNHELDFTNGTVGTLAHAIEAGGEFEMEFQDSKSIRCTAQDWGAVTDNLATEPIATVVKLPENHLDGNGTIVIRKVTLPVPRMPHRLQLEVPLSHLEHGQVLLAFWHPIIKDLPAPGQIPPPNTNDNQ